MMIVALLPIQAVAQGGESSAEAKKSAEGSEGGYIIEESPGVKKLNVKELELAPGTRLIELLDMFPELLSREGDSRLDNYDVQIGGISTGVSKEAALYHILAQNIESVVVAQSPSMTQQVKGQGAVINVTMKELKEGSSGCASLQAGTLAYVTPSASINYKEGGFALRAALLMEYKQPLHNETFHSWEENGVVHTTSADTTRQRYGYELARIQADWEISGTDMLKVWAWESYSHDNIETKMLTSTPLAYRWASEQRQDRFSMAAGCSYQHKFEHSVLNTRLEYALSPTADNFSKRMIPGVSTLAYTSSRRNDGLSGVTSYTYNLGGAGARSGGTGGAEARSGGTGNYALTGGVNYSWSPTKVYYSETGGFAIESELDTRIRMFYLSPYAEASASWEAVTLSAGARYQLTVPTLQIADGQAYSSSASDATAFIKCGWRIRPHHYINLVLDRSSNKPDARALYPFRYYDPAVAGYVKGNADLLPMGLHNATLNYIFEQRFGGKDIHNLVISASLQYIKATNIICNTYSREYNSYINGGDGDILAANAMAYYRYGIFSANLDFNLFQNWTHIQGAYDSYFYYNVSLVGVLSFPRGWKLSPKVIYHSKITTNTSKLGDYLYAHLNLGKSWHRWSIYAEYQDIFHSQVRDIIQEGDQLHSRTYNLRHPNLLIGGIFSF